jgi:tRNA1(Val) A37 N6-methylase TrmN6
LTLIHRAEVLEELLSLLKGRFGALAIYPLFPKKGAPAKRVLVQGIKGSRAPLELLQGMVLHEADGSYTQEADLILRDGAGLGIRQQA